MKFRELSTETSSISGGTVRNQLGFNVKWNSKTIALFGLLLVLPNILGAINLSTPWGFKIHFFQLAIFAAAMIYGPKGGLLSGLVGSAYSAALMSNPYILLGNAILGFFTGLFARYGYHTLVAVAIAYAIQLPWLILTDYYLVHLPGKFIIGLVIALAISNLVWATIAHYSVKPIRKSLKL